LRRIPNAEETFVLRRGLIGVAIAVLTAAPLGAQPPRPLAPVPEVGQRVAPFFDGWYQNPDGTVTLSFGYSNLTRHDIVEIPRGPDNIIEPKEFDGSQPTAFVPATPDGPDAGGGARPERQRGVFTVTVPAGFKGDVVWTLRHGGQTFSVPGRARTGAYQLRWPMAMGSVPPLLRFTEEGTAGRGPVGITADPQKATVGTPLSLAIWTVDDSVREKEPVAVASRRESKAAAINVNWYKHSGPGPVTFTPAKHPIAELKGTVTTAVTFSQPGEYVLRVRADNFGRLDTSAGNQCCWTNGYVKVTVAK
jgi:hypothetical protein